MSEAIIQNITMPDGSTLSIETGKLAKLADGSVVLRVGNTMLLASVCSNKEAKPDQSFFPLMVDYQEKFASTGRIPGGFFRREGRLSDYEVLISRLIDRALRPLFPEDYLADTQVLVYLISCDEDTLPDSYACLAASAALAVSDVPFDTFVSEVRVVQKNGQFIVNPKRADATTADLDLMVAGTLDSIVMVEGEMNEASEETMVDAIKVAHEAIKVQCLAQKELATRLQKAKRDYAKPLTNEELKDQIFTATYSAMADVAEQGLKSKKDRKEAFGIIKKEFLATLPEDIAPEQLRLAKNYLEEVEYNAVRKTILTKRTRLDGRQLDEIRHIWSEVDYLPTVHGSAVFTRGETQSLTTITLGSKLDEQIIDGAVFEGTEKLILHYNFTPFSTGEVKPMRGVGRREVGHGNLALRGLRKMVPTGPINPYTIRIVSDILESNGSSSMATVCAGSLALFDAGVQMKKHVSGIAMGLITDETTGEYAVLSDILGDEDHLGDMDFKVVGTEDGITACQMDIKVKGLSYDILLSALLQAKAGRLHILNKMKETIETPRPDYKPFAPRIVQLEIPKELIGAVIGPGGKVIQEIQRETSTVITITEAGDKGLVDVSSNNGDDLNEAIRRIKIITTLPEVGAIYEATVKSIKPFGAFCEILPGKEGLMHISEYDWKRIDTLESVIKEGDVLTVKLFEFDKKSGKPNLSRKALLPRPPQQAKPAPSENTPDQQ